MRQGYEAFNRGDIEAAFKDFAPDFECDMSRAVGFNVDRDIYDIDQFRRLFDEYVGSWKDFQLGRTSSSTRGIDVVDPVARTECRGQRDRVARPRHLRLDDSRGSRRQGLPLPGARRGPRSRRAVGVGDVGGERRDRAVDLRGWLAGEPGSEHMDPEIAMVESKTLPGAVEAYGMDAVRRYIESFTKYWEDIRFEPQEFIDAGDHVVVDCSTSGPWKAQWRRR